VRIDIRKTEQLKNGNDIYGNRVKCKIVKNKVAPPFKVAEFDILYGKGISRFGEVVDIAIALDIIKKSGSWFSYEGERLCQGKENVRKIVEGNPEMFEALNTKVREMSKQMDLEDDEFDMDEDGEDDFDIRALKDGDED
jgi:recombination protein RecA